MVIWIIRIRARHSLANIQLFNFGQYPRPEVVFFNWNISGTFVGVYDPSPKNFSILRFCVSCLCPFMLNISLFCYINDFTCADTGNRCYTGNTVCLEGYAVVWVW